MLDGVYRMTLSLLLVCSVKFFIHVILTKNLSPAPQPGCCQSDDIISPLTCFATAEHYLEKYCIDLGQLLATDHGRCSSSANCRNNHTCLSLSKPSQEIIILTVSSWDTYVNVPSSNERRILWTGPRSELFDQRKYMNLCPDPDFRA
jgi:hypothetical protein